MFKGIDRKYLGTLFSIFKFILEIFYYRFNMIKDLNFKGVRA